MSTYNEVYEYVKAATITFCKDNHYFTTTESISGELNVSRTVVSRYLNKLLLDNKLIKISARPVIFYDKKVLENYYKVFFDEREFMSVSAFMNYIESLKKINSFDKIIGQDQSLNDILLRINTFLKYPKNRGIMGIICGAKGVGKKYLVKCLFEQAKNINDINKDSKLFTYNCEKSENVEEAIFGRKDKKGLLELADNSIVYMHNADLLDLEFQKKLFFFLENGKIDSDNFTERYLNVGVILSTEENPGEVFSTSIIDYAIMNIKVPDLENRTNIEKERLTLYWLRNEEKRLGKQIFITNYAFNALIHYEYKNNIDGLKHAIRIASANANYTDNHENKIEINLYHLPEPILKSNTNEDLSESKVIYNLTTDIRSPLFNDIISYYNEILKCYEDYNLNQIDEKYFIKTVNDVLHRYCDYIVFEKNPTNQRIDTYKSIIDGIIDIISKKYKVIMYSNCSYVLARLIYKLAYLDCEIQNWEKEHELEINNIVKIFSNNYKNEYILALEIVELINKMIDIELNSINTLFLLTNILFYNKSDHNNKIIGFVVAHGYSTASSIVDSVNRLLETNVLYPIDMPLDINVINIVENIRSYLTEKSNFDEVILMVDMGSLEEIGSMLTNFKNISIGVINNISTKVALSVGSKIIQRKELKEILESTCEEASFEYKIYKNQKKNTIIFTTETGMDATKRMLDIFRKSIPKNINIDFITYDGSILMKEMKNNTIFNDYNILMITGTIEINIPGIPFIAVEDLIEFNDIEKLDNIFKPYLTNEELHFFNNNLIKNFSLGNIMQYLTILNGQILLEYIEEAVERIQQYLRITLTNKIKLRVYIHVSCLIERLVTRQPSLEFKGLNVFVEEHRDFIDLFSKSFYKLSEHYNIEIPANEIAYLYEYIFDEYYYSKDDDKGDLFND